MDKTNTVNATDFGVDPTGQHNSLEQFREAIERFRSLRASRLQIAPGRYLLRNEEAVKLQEKVLRGEYGINPQEKMYYPYAPYVRGLDFSGIEGLSIEAEGVLFLCYGWMEILSLENCRNISIRGLSLDYKRKPFSAGQVLDATAEYVDVRVDSEFPIVENVATPRAEFWDKKAQRMYPHSVDIRENQLLCEQCLRLYGNFPELPPPENLQVMLPHSMHFRPAILLHLAQDIRLENVSIHSQPGMGIVGHRAHNVVMEGMRIEPSLGLHLSTNTDATHFTSCSGLLRFAHCHFEGQGDDATNIHNYYYQIKKKISACCYEITLLRSTHAQVLDYPDPGDRLALVERSSLKELQELQVKAVKCFPEAWKVQIEFDEKLPDGALEELLLANVSRLPRVEFVHSRICHHRARGALIKSRDVLIEGCEIVGSTGTAIHVGAEYFWYEGVCCTDLTIRNNRIRGCGLGDGQIDGASAIAVTVEAEDKSTVGLHKRIVIENNDIEVEGDLIGIRISNAEAVLLRGNRIRGTEQQIKVCHSSDVVLSEAPSTP